MQRFCVQALFAITLHAQNQDEILSQDSVNLNHLIPPPNHNNSQITSLTNSSTLENVSTQTTSTTQEGETAIKSVISYATQLHSLYGPFKILDPGNLSEENFPLDVGGGYYFSDLDDLMIGLVKNPLQNLHSTQSAAQFTNDIDEVIPGASKIQKLTKSTSQFKSSLKSTQLFDIDKPSNLINLNSKGGNQNTSLQYGAEVRSLTKEGILSLGLFSLKDGQKVPIELTENIIETLNSDPEAYMVLQKANAGALPPIIDKIPPSSPNQNQKSSSQEQKQSDLQNIQKVIKKRKELGLIDWQATEFTKDTLTVQLDFDDPQQVSVIPGSPDALYITLKLDQKTAPQFLREILPPQTGKITKDGSKSNLWLEIVGKVLTIVLCLLIVANFLVNNLMSRLDFVSLFDALEGLQLLLFVSLFYAKYPSWASTLVYEERNVIQGDIFGVLGQLFGSESTQTAQSPAFNSQASNADFQSLYALANLGSELVYMIIYALTALCVVLIGLSLAKKGQKRNQKRLNQIYHTLKDWLFYGALINLFLIFYLPLLVSQFINIATMRWTGSQDQTFVSFNNVVSLLITHTLLFTPLLLFVKLWKGRNEVGKFRKSSTSADSLEQNLKRGINSESRHQNAAKPQVSQKNAIQPISAEMENNKDPQMLKEIMQKAQLQEPQQIRSKIGMNLWNFDNIDQKYLLTKESVGRSEFDQAYGEWYKKMAINEYINSKETIFFFNFWQTFRKVTFALTVIFFERYLALQIILQLAISAIMVIYIGKFGSFVRKQDNLAKIINEITFILSILMLPLVMSASAGVSLMAGSVIFGAFIFSNLYHIVKLALNTISAVKVAKKYWPGESRPRSQEDKWTGTPVIQQQKIIGFYEKQDQNLNNEAQIVEKPQKKEILPEKKPVIAKVEERRRVVEKQELPKGPEIGGLQKGQADLPQIFEKIYEKQTHSIAQIRQNCQKVEFLGEIKDELLPYAPTITQQRSESEMAQLPQGPACPEDLTKKLPEPKMKQAPQIDIQAFADEEIPVRMTLPKKPVQQEGKDTERMIKQAVTTTQEDTSEIEKCNQSKRETLQDETSQMSKTIESQRHKSFEVAAITEQSEQYNQDGPKIPKIRHTRLPQKPKISLQSTVKLFEEIKQVSHKIQVEETADVPPEQPMVLNRTARDNTPLKEHDKNPIPNRHPFQIHDIPFKPVKGNLKQLVKQTSPERSQISYHSNSQYSNRRLNGSQSPQTPARRIQQNSNIKNSSGKSRHSQNVRNNGLSSVENGGLGARSTTDDDEFDPDFVDPDGWLAVRKPDKNRLTIQQLTHADRDGWSRVILQDIDVNVVFLLRRLRNERKIMDFKAKKTPPTAEVFLNGGLVRMTSFADKVTKKKMRTGLNRMFRNYEDSHRGFRISPEREREVRNSTPTRPFYTSNEPLRSSMQADPLDFTETEFSAIQNPNSNNFNPKSTKIKYTNPATTTTLMSSSGDRNAIRRVVGSSQNRQEPPRTAAIGSKQQLKGHLQKHNFMVPSSENNNPDDHIAVASEEYGQIGHNGVDNTESQKGPPLQYNRVDFLQNQRINSAQYPFTLTNTNTNANTNANTSSGGVYVVNQTQNLPIIETAMTQKGKYRRMNDSDKNTTSFLREQATQPDTLDHFSSQLAGTMSIYNVPPVNKQSKPSARQTLNGKIRVTSRTRGKKMGGSQTRGASKKTREGMGVVGNTLQQQDLGTQLKRIVNKKKGNKSVERRNQISYQVAASKTCEHNGDDFESGEVEREMSGGPREIIKNKGLSLGRKSSDDQNTHHVFGNLNSSVGDSMVVKNDKNGEVTTNNPAAVHNNSLQEEGERREFRQVKRIYTAQQDLKIAKTTRNSVFENVESL